VKAFRSSKPISNVLATETTRLLEVRPTDLTVDGLYREFALTVARWAARLGGGLVDANDVTQEVFIKVQRELSTFRGEAKVTTWLYQITLNVVRNCRRAEAFRRLFRAPAEKGMNVPDAEPLAVETLARGEVGCRLH
jgi:RNA polymerase sigma-70 factor (ECF subfamily)